MQRLSVSLVLCAVLLAPAGCARDTGEAGVKPIGVGFDPGELFPGPEERGGVIDITLVNTRGSNLDFGVTGWFGSAGAFVEPDNDPFDALLAWGWFFSPAIVAADESAALTPKGPDLEDACFVQAQAGGPLGVFTTVDVGDQLLFTNASEDPALRTEFAVNRDPQAYPVNSSSVFIYYVGTAPYRPTGGAQQLAPNWPFGEDVEMQFSGGLPPENAPVASIPLPSDAADDRVGKEAGHPSVYTPGELTGVLLSNRLDDDGQVPLRYEPTSAGLPDPRNNDGVLHLVWDAPEEDADASVVTVAVLLLGGDEPEQISNQFGEPDFCLPAEPLEVDGERDDAWFIEYTARKERWCDAEFEPDLEVGNDEFGLDLLGEDTCHNGIDDNADGFCDEGGCEDADGNWLLPDSNCHRHVYKTSSCGGDGLCRDVGGDRSGDGHLAQLVCTAADDGDFVVPADQIAELLSVIDVDAVEGAVLKVARTSETLIDVPMVRDQIGNEDNINPVRLRASQLIFGRFEWE